MEMHFKYLERVTLTEQDMAKEGLDRADDEEEMYLRRLSGGLFSLQLIDYIIVDACSSGSASVKQRVLKFLNQRNASIKTIRNVVREYAGNVGEAAGSISGKKKRSKEHDDMDIENDERSRLEGEQDDEIASEQERTQLLHLVDKF